MELLALDGRISVITFHSLEDRLTKQLFKEASTVDVPKGLPFIPEDMKPTFELVSRKPILPSQEELAANNRAHSAKLRVAKKSGNKLMTNEKELRQSQMPSKRIRTFSRIEKAFYATIIITAITMAVSIIYLQSRKLQLQQDITSLNSQISDQKIELNNAKQEVNELSRRDRIVDIAGKAGLSNRNENIKKVE